MQFPPGLIAIPFDIFTGSNFAVTWDGGEMAEVFHVSGDELTLVERWRMHTPDGRPLAEFSHAGLAEVTAFRVERVAGIDRLFAAGRAVSAFQEPVATADE